MKSKGQKLTAKVLLIVMIAMIFYQWNNPLMKNALAGSSLSVGDYMLFGERGGDHTKWRVAEVSKTDGAMLMPVTAIEGGLDAVNFSRTIALNEKEAAVLNTSPLKGKASSANAGIFLLEVDDIDQIDGNLNKGYAYNYSNSTEQVEPEEDNVESESAKDSVSGTVPVVYLNTAQIKEMDGLGTKKDPYIDSSITGFATKTDVSVETAAVVVGEKVKLTATVKTMDNIPVKGGTVNFYLDGEIVGKSAEVGSKGTATAEITLKAEGSYVVMAEYLGGTGYFPSEEDAQSATTLSAIKGEVEEEEAEVAEKPIPGEPGAEVPGEEPGEEEVLEPQEIEEVDFLFAASSSITVSRAGSSGDRAVKLGGPISGASSGYTQVNYYSTSQGRNAYCLRADMSSPISATTYSYQGTASEAIRGAIYWGIQGGYSPLAISAAVHMAGAAANSDVSEWRSSVVSGNTTEGTQILSQARAILAKGNCPLPSSGASGSATLSPSSQRVSSSQWQYQNGYFYATATVTASEKPIYNTPSGWSVSLTQTGTNTWRFDFMVSESYAASIGYQQVNLQVGSSSGGWFAAYVYYNNSKQPVATYESGTSTPANGTITFDAPPMYYFDILKKGDDTNQPISGAIFRVTYPNGTYKDVTVNGQTTVGPLTLTGTYTVTEIQPPSGYSMGNPTTQTINLPSQNRATLTYTNIRQRGNLELIKLDDLTGNRLKGCEFQLYTSANQLVTVGYVGAGQYSGTSGTATTTLTTDDSGRLIVNNLPTGSYYFKETKAPRPYIEAPNINSTTVNVPNQQTASITMRNKYQPYDLILQKRDGEELTKPVLGCKFKLKILDKETNTSFYATMSSGSNGNYTFNPQSLINKPNNSAATVLDTDGSGNLKVVGVYAGLYNGDAKWVYAWEEVSAPEPYSPGDDSPWRNPTIVSDRTYTMPNWMIRGRIYIKKKSGDPAYTDALGNSYSLAGAEFKIWKASLGENWQTVDQNSVKTVTITAQGVCIPCEIPGVRPAGPLTPYSAESPLLSIGIDKTDYYVQESKAPPGYTLALKQKITLRNDPDAPKDSIYEITEIADNPAKGQIRIIKQDVDNNSTTPRGDASLLGAKFQVWRNENNEKGGAASYEACDPAYRDEVTVDSAAGTLSKVLPLGKYTVKEVVAPPGYTVNDQLYEVNITRLSENQTISVHDLIVKDKVREIQIQVRKFRHRPDEEGTGEEHMPLPNIEFEIRLKRTGELVETIKTDENGYAISKKLPYGTYVVHELTPPYIEPFPDFEVIGHENGKIYEYEHTDELDSKDHIDNIFIPVEFKITKIASDTGKTIMKEGAKYLIYAHYPDGETRKIKYVDPKTGIIYGSEENPFAVNSEGFIVLPKPLEYGSYTIVEVASPDFYLLDPVPRDFTIDLVDVQNGYKYIEFDNQNQMTRIQVLKTGSFFEDSTFEYLENYEVDFYTPITVDHPLADARFDVIAAEDIYTGDGTLRYEKGEIVDSLTTDDQGAAITKELFVGKYEVVETYAPNGFVLDTSRPIVDTTPSAADNTIIPVVTFTHNRNNILQPPRFSFLKEKEIWSPSRDGNFTYVPAEGVKFGLFANEDIKAFSALDEETGEPKVIIPQGGLVEIVESNADGIGESSVHIPMGKYYFKELEPLKFYKLVEDEFEVEAAYIGMDEGYSPAVANDGIPIQNDMECRKIQIIKVSSKNDDDRLEGAVFDIFDDYGNLVTTVRTNAQGVAETKLLPIGIYYAQETTAPEGYKLDRNKYLIDMTHLTTTLYCERIISNEPIRVELMKYVKGSKSVLAGAKMQVLDSNGDIFYEGYTNKNGMIVLNRIPVGTYTFKEVEAPDGYILNKELYTFTVEKDGTITGTTAIYNEKEIPPPPPPPPPVDDDVITKRDITDGKPVPGATIEIMDSNGKVIYSGVSDERGEVRYPKPPPGKYTFKETLAPSGYALNVQTFEFEITEDGIHKGVAEYDDDVTRVQILKVAEGTDEPLAGAEFGLYSEDGKPLMSAVTGEDGLAKFERILYGTYLIKEIKAPEGFLLSSEVLLINTKGGKYVNVAPYKIENQRPVRTGVDNTSTMLMLLGVALAAWLVLRKSRRFER